VDGGRDGGVSLPCLEGVFPTFPPGGAQNQWSGATPWLGVRGLTFKSPGTIPWGRVLREPSERLEARPLIKQCLIVCLPTPGPGTNEWAERGSEPGKGRARRAELQLLTWGKGNTKAPFSTFQAGSNVLSAFSPFPFLSWSSHNTNLHRSSSRQASQAGFQLAILLPQSFKCWDYSLCHQVRLCFVCLFGSTEI
jgi:hypothetical protein